jgi:hypothetical protein
MNPRAKKVVAMADHRLRIEFTNGEIGIYDCTPLLKFGVFKELDEPAYFRRVRSFNGSVVWPHEQDICPDTLYLDSLREQRTMPLRAGSNKYDLAESEVRRGGTLVRETRSVDGITKGMKAAGTAKKKSKRPAVMKTGRKKPSA